MIDATVFMKSINFLILPMFLVTEMTIIAIAMWNFCSNVFLESDPETANWEKNTYVTNFLFPSMS